MTASGAAAQYYEAAGAYFSREVDLLDELDRTNPIHSYFRRESIATLERAFSPPGPLLEFGYGTGTEAIHLARRGFQIVGVDPSKDMWTRARSKAEAAGVAPACQFRLGSTGDAGALLDEFGAGAFRGAFATLGPLNCEPDLRRFSQAVAQLLSPGSRLVVCVINKYCVWESLLFLAAGDFRRAFRRQVRGWGDLVDPSGGSRVRVLLYSPGSFAHFFQEGFTVEECFGLPSVLPPPYAAPRVGRVKGLLPLLERADMRLKSRWPLPWLGDHFEMVLRRR